MRALVFVLAVAWPAAALADARTDFETGRGLFASGQYARAAEAFEALIGEPIDPNSPDLRKRTEIVQAARPLHAASLVALGRIADADRVILDHLRDDPFYEPPAGQFPEPVIQRVLAVAAQHAEELEGLRQKVLRERQEAVALQQLERARERQRLDALQRSSREETVLTQRSRIVALAPFGMGQFQNGSEGLGVFFAVSEAVGVGASVATFVAAQHFAAADCRVEDCAAASRGFSIARSGNWIAVGATAALMVAGALEAEVSLIPEERSVRPRTAATLVPVVSAVPAGVWAGVGGRF